MAQLEGVFVVNLDQAHRRLATVCERADVLVVNGVCSADLLPLMLQRKQARKPTVFEINDDVQQIQPSNPLAGFFAQPENIRLFRRLALTADAVQYSVPELERVYGSLNRRGKVFYNQLERVPPLRDAAPSAGLSIGWGGSAGHLEDMAEVAAALVDFVRRQPSVTLHLMCSDRIWQLFDALPESRKRRTPVGSIDDYYRFVSALDIGIAPNRDKGFNRARSDVKFLEYAGYGAVAVVQRLTPYLESVRHGETGLLFDTPRELCALLEQLIADSSWRRAIRQQAHAYAANERRQSDHAAERLQFYDSLFDAPAAGDASRFFAELATLEGAEVSGRHLVLSHTRFETALHDGLVLLQQPGQTERGSALLREAVRLEPQHPLPELFLGSVTGDAAALSTALAKQPRSVQALLALGGVELAAGKFKPALERFLAAAELAPGYEMPFAHAAQALAKLGANKEAEELERLAQNMARALGTGAL